MEMMLAARMCDQVGGHGNTLAGMVTGALIGVAAVVGAALLFGTPVGWVALAVGACIAVGTTASMAALGGRFGKTMLSGSPCSEIGGECSPNVSIENQQAARANQDFGTHDHPLLSQGSATVLVNKKNLVRVGDGVACGGKVLKGCKHTWIGGAKAGAPPPDPMDKWIGRLETTAKVAFLAAAIIPIAEAAVVGGVAAGVEGGVLASLRAGGVIAAKLAGKSALGAAQFMGGTYAVHAVATKYGGERAGLIVDAAANLVGLGMGARGLGKAPEVRTSGAGQVEPAPAPEGVAEPEAECTTCARAGESGSGPVARVSPEATAADDDVGGWKNPRPQGIQKEPLVFAKEKGVTSWGGDAAIRVRKLPNGSTVTFVGKDISTPIMKEAYRVASSEPNVDVVCGHGTPTDVAGVKGSELPKVVPIHPDRHYVFVSCSTGKGGAPVVRFFAEAARVTAEGPAGDLLVDGDGLKLVELRNGETTVKVGGKDVRATPYGKPGTVQAFGPEGPIARPCMTCEPGSALPGNPAVAVGKGSSSPEGVWAPTVVNLGGEGEVPGALDLNTFNPDTLRSPLPKIQARNPGKQIQGDMNHMPFADGSVDQLVGQKVPSPLINTLPAEALRVLKPGGTLKIYSQSGGPEVWVDPMTAAGFENVHVEQGFAVGVRGPCPTCEGGAAPPVKPPAPAPPAPEPGATPVKGLCDISGSPNYPESRLSTYTNRATGETLQASDDGLGEAQRNAEWGKTNRGAWPADEPICNVCGAPSPKNEMSTYTVTRGSGSGPHDLVVCDHCRQEIANRREWASKPGFWRGPPP